MEKIKGLLERKEGEVIGIASTETPDRDGEVIKQMGWDLKNFKTNPVIMLAHNYQELPIGKATDIRVEENKLVFKAIFSEATQKAKEAYALVKEGILNTFSVGFIPREYDSKDNNIITKAELLEISLVPVPANPEAIVMAKSYKNKNELLENLVKHWLIEEKDSLDNLEPKEEELEAIEKEELETEVISDSTTEVGEPDKTNGEDGAGSDIELDVKLLQSATGHLQKILCDIKKKGGAKLK